MIQRFFLFIAFVSATLAPKVVMAQASVSSPPLPHYVCTGYIGTRNFAGMPYTAEGLLVAGNILYVASPLNGIIKLSTDTFQPIGSIGSLYQTVNPVQPAPTSNQSIVDDGPMFGTLRLMHARDGEPFIGTENGTIFSAKGRLVKPRGMAINEAGNLIVADSFDSSIQEFQPNGTWKSMRVIPDRIDQGQFYVTVVAVACDNTNHIVYNGGTAQPPVSAYYKTPPAHSYNIGGSGPGNIANINCLAVAPNHDLYVGDFGNRRVSVFDQSGRFIRECPIPVESGSMAPAIVAISINHQGDVYLAVRDGIEMLSNNGEFVPLISFYTAPDSIQPDQHQLQPLAITCDDYGNIYVAEDSTIARLSPEPVTAGQ